MYRFFAFLSLLTVSFSVFSLPKNFDVGKIIQEKSPVLKIARRLGVDTYGMADGINREMNKTYPEIQRGTPEVWMGSQKGPVQCVGKERSLGNGVVKCKNGYFKDEQ